MPIMGKGVLKTIVYYDCFDYPLTREELNVFSFRDIGEVNLNLIEELSGFYFLKGRKNLVEIRKERNKIAKKKWHRTLKVIKWFRLVPYIKIIFASGSLALSNTAKESDLDVLIVVKHGRIWTARFLTVVLLSLLGVRRTRYEKIAPDKICLNHFITDKSLYIPRKSIYTAQLYARLVPILWDDEKLINEFYQANSWIKEYIPKFSIFNLAYSAEAASAAKAGQFSNNFQIPNSKFPKFIKKLGEMILDTKLGDWLENLLKKYQLRRIKNYHLTYKSGGRVKADDESLEFHPDSPELKIIEKYNQKMIGLGFEDLTEKSSFAK